MVGASPNRTEILRKTKGGLLGIRRILTRSKLSQEGHNIMGMCCMGIGCNCVGCQGRVCMGMRCMGMRCSGSHCGSLMFGSSSRMRFRGVECSAAFSVSVQFAEHVVSVSVCKPYCFRTWRDTARRRCRARDRTAPII